MRGVNSDNNVQAVISELFANRTTYFQLLEKLEAETGLSFDAGLLQSEIDCEHDSKTEASQEDVAAVLSIASK